MNLDEELDELLNGPHRPTIGELFYAMATVAKKTKLRISITQNADGSFEYSFEPWQPYTPMCPYARSGDAEEVSGDESAG